MNPSNWIDGFKPADSAPPQTLWRFVFWSLKGSYPVLILAIFFAVLSGFIEVATALLLGIVTDGAIDHGPDFITDKSALLLLIAGFFLILRPVVIGANTGIQALVIGPNVFPLVLSRLHRYTLNHSVQFFDNDFAGRIAQKQMQTARAINEATIESINVVAFSLASLFGAAALLSAIDWRISLILSVWLVLYVSLIRWFLPRVRKRAKARAGARAVMTGQIVDTVTNIKTVKLFAHNDYEDTAAINALKGLREKTLAFGVIATWFRFTLMTLAGIVPVLLVGAALWLWSLGEITPGGIVTTGAISLRISMLSARLSFVLMGIYSAIGEIEDGMKTLTPAHDLIDAEGAPKLQVSNATVQFENVSFSYGRETGGISDINLTVRSGEKLGIVGASGAGKSTLMALLMRLYDPETGVISIDDQPVNSVTQESLRRQIGMVTQETAMFNRSAHDNIIYGRPGASKADVISAAKKAEADEFIQDLKDFKGRMGYDAHLGERGVKLSGGQRQRIALARAILKDAPILVLDEATSALDSEVEAAIQTALSRVMQGKTVLAIAHRLSTIARMDRIIVLDQGQIIEEGTHAELLAQKGKYAGFWERQSGGFIGTEQPL